VDATVRFLIIAVFFATAIFLPGFAPGSAEAKGQRPSCQFTINIPNLNVYPLSTRLKGDDKIDGKSRIELEAKIQRSGDNKTKGSNGLRLYLNVKIAEFKGDRTSYKGHQAFWLLDP